MEDGRLIVWLLLYITVIADAEVERIVPHITDLRVAEIFYTADKGGGQETLVTKIDRGFFFSIRPCQGFLQLFCQVKIIGDVDGVFPHLFQVDHIGAGIEDTFQDIGEISLFR